MKWRDVFIGSLVTLIATVVGGVILFYLTQKAPPPALAEKLVYDIDRPVVFDSDQTTLSFINVRVKNIGDKPAENVVVGIEFGDKVKITDRRASLSSGPAGKIDTKVVSDNKLDVRIRAFTPGEIATVAILTDTADEIIPIVGVKCDSSTGQRGSLTTLIRMSRSRTTHASDIIANFVLFALIAQTFLLIFMRRRLGRFIRRFVPARRDFNNTAFVFLHGGLTDEALGLLSKGISESGAEPYMLANYGLALGLKGETEQSKQVLEAADFWADVNAYERAVIAFNRSILAFTEKDEVRGLALMKKAFGLSKREIVRYLRYSVIVADLRKQNPELHSLLNEHGVLKKDR